MKEEREREMFYRASEAIDEGSGCRIPNQLKVSWGRLVGSSLLCNRQSAPTLIIFIAMLRDRYARDMRGLHWRSAEMKSADEIRFEHSDIPLIPIILYIYC